MGREVGAASIVLAFLLLSAFLRMLAVTRQMRRWKGGEVDEVWHLGRGVEGGVVERRESNRRFQR